MKVLCKSLCALMLLLLLNRLLGVELLGHVVSLFKFVMNCQTVSQSGCPISLPMSSVGEFQFSYTLTDTCYCLSF